MKGLLLKDFYMTIKYCRAYLLTTAAFILGSVYSDNTFFIFYPCFFCGMISVTLLGYDERSKWSQYCEALPYTKTQIVSGKYLIGLFAQIAAIALSALTQAVKMNIRGTFNSKNYLILMALLLICSCLFSSIILPFIFKFGVEKGRIAYYILIGAVCVVSAAATTLFENMETVVKFSANELFLILCIAAVGIYVLSWYLSIVFYKKRDNSH